MSKGDLILIVEDEPVTRLGLRACLEGLGYVVIEAQNGEEALECSIQKRPNLVLMDVGLPGINGFEACRRMKTDAWTRDTPILFISGQSGASDRLEAFQAGGVDYLTKPVQPEEVKVRVQTHLDLHAQKRLLVENQSVLLKALFDAKVLNAKFIEMNEKLRLSEELKSQFISNMRNEINNPLSAIMAIAEEIADPGFSRDRIQQLASIVKSEAFHMDFQMRNIFCAAELEAGETRAVITRVDVPSIVRALVDSFMDFARTKSVSIQMPDPEPPFLFETDATMLRLIGENLLSNAIEFNRKNGNTSIQIRIVEDTLHMEIRDEGIGIRPEDRGAIFERFHQLDSGSTRAHSGCGLGLSVVKALLEILGGSIHVESEPNGGSLFTCLIPRGAIADDASTESFEGNLFFFGEPEEM